MDLLKQHDEQLWTVLIEEQSLMPQVSRNDSVFGTPYRIKVGQHYHSIHDIYQVNRKVAWVPH